MIPDRRLLIVLALLATAGLLPAIWSALTPLWWAFAIAATLIVAFDMLALLKPVRIRAEREIASSIPLDVWKKSALHLHLDGAATLHAEVFDHCPDNTEFRGLPQTVTLRTQGSTTVRYEFRAAQRGELLFDKLQLRQLSPLRLWQRSRLLPCESATRVYPNFSVMSKYLLLATDNHLSHMGIRKRQRRGEGQDFLQLREYRQGDALRQVDWRATSRMRKLISREYQEERDQEIVFLVDCGKRMLAQDDTLSHFDHTLNAVLLLAYVALRQGDAVGIGTFAGALRWLRPTKGVATVNRILNTVYDLQPTTLAPDYTSAVLQVLARQRKRALVVIITNVREEDSSDLLPALHTLKKHHLVLLASMKEQAVQNVFDSEVDDFDDALRVAATYDYVEQRQRAFEQIRASGVISLDVLPEQLSVSLVNRYLDIKSSGRL